VLKLPELSKYELIEEIGHGGMATVYRARDRRLGREVAIKLIHRHLRDSAEVAERFAREATAVAKLRHPNIVEVFDISDPDEGEQYLVVELIRGMTLRERLRQGALPPEVAVAVVLEVGAALEHAHQQGVIHRDVKPENVLIELTPASEPGVERTGPHIKLTDFGIAKLLDAQGVTATGQVLGSPAHMAPEQIEGGAVDARTDVFALGVLLYECMVGRLPFQGEHPAQVLRKVLDGEFVPPERQDPKIGAQYSRIVVRALARLPEQRFDSVQAFMDTLLRELAALGYVKLHLLLDALVRPDPDFYDELVPRLVERGSQARAEGRISAAADHFGRALAYRPGDRQLLRRVSGLERYRKLRRVGRWALAGLAFGSLGLGIFYQVSAGMAEREQAERIPSGSRAPGPVPSLAPPPVPIPAAVEHLVEPSPVAVKPRGAPSRTNPARRVTVPPLVPPQEPQATREVVVRITGAMGGTLKIDGEPVQWFGNVRHSLSLGPHRFEFVAPDNTCCKSSERTVSVVAGEGPQQVIGEIAFLDATLRVTAEQGHSGLLTCPTLFAGDQRFPGERPVAMSRVRASGTCTLRPETSGALPQKTEVTLRAGQTTVIPWP
jgi:tRNA A-37 threonylcarbamoyl transferase component Bud32